MGPEVQGQGRNEKGPRPGLGAGLIPALGECRWGDQSYKSETLLIVT